jgi:hypothetical protein
LNGLFSLVCFSARKGVIYTTLNISIINATNLTYFAELDYSSITYYYSRCIKYHEYDWQNWKDNNLKAGSKGAVFIWKIGLFEQGQI